MFCDLFFIHSLISIDTENWKEAVPTGASLVNLEDFIILCVVLERLGDIRGLIEVSVWMLTNSAESNVYGYILNTFQRYEVSCVAIDRASKIFVALYEKVALTTSLLYIYPARFAKGQELSAYWNRCVSSPHGRDYAFAHSSDR